ncbi:MAG TPA: alanine racemase [Ktedonobacteraceae bacterium]|nr:alanine racemase [Ktedonobacteraceae bacterium]
MILLDYLLEATRGVLVYPGKQSYVEAFSHDSRQLLPGEMFVAVRGEHSDGHDYVLDAVQRGAAGLLAEAQAVNGLPEDTRQAIQQANIPLVVVEDTRIALQHYARFILERWHPTVIAVTGSTGKTSTKEALASVLSSNFATFKSWQNYNDLLGIPLSLGRLEQRHEYAVVELGCDHPGEMSDLCRIVQPTIGVLTNVSPAQLQYFGTLERYAAELAMLLTALPADGIGFVNGDESNTHETDTGFAGRIIRYYPSQAQDVQVTWNGVQCIAPHSPIPLTSHLLGRHHVATMLAAHAVATYCGMQPAEIQHALARLQPLSGRLNPLAGVHDTMLLDDTHNATPSSVSAGLETLKMLPAGRRIAILGDMVRLGDYDEEAHRLVGRKVAQCADFLIVHGERSVIVAESAMQAGLPAKCITITSTHEDAAQVARQITEDANTGRSGSNFQHTDVLLIKGSEETRMERVTELLLAQPVEAPERLVRQTPGWKQIVVMRAERPTWVEIDLSAIASNTRQLKALVGPHVRLLVSLKADAYGHGALKVARTVLHNGASMIGVATASEAIPLREAGIQAPMLVFGYVPLWQMREAVRLNLTVTLYSLESAQALSRAALALGRTVNVHVKVDTGMGRLGIRAEDVDAVIELVEAVRALPNLYLEGLFTHFATADSLDQTQARLQLARFQTILQALDERGLRPPLVHAANSAATLSLPEAHFTMVRPGIALYGLDPSPDVCLPEGFRPALSFKTQVAQVKLLPEGECISYGCTYTTECPTLVATLPVGYADGFRRAPYTWGTVLIHGQEAPIVGRVCMDQCMVNVSHIPQTRVGDEVVLIGRQGNAMLTAEQVAQRLGTINYEVVSAILARVPRVD